MAVLRLERARMCEPPGNRTRVKKSRRLGRRGARRVGCPGEGIGSPVVAFRYEMRSGKAAKRV